MPRPTHKIIFLAEDNAADVGLVEEALKRHGIEYRLAVYRDAQAAILAVEKCGSGSRPVPDLVLLDLNLPWGTGCDVLSAAALNPVLADVPKAILSSFIGSTEEVDRARRLGASTFILKPANFEQFINEVGTQVALLLESGQRAASSGGGDLT